MITKKPYTGRMNEKITIQRFTRSSDGAGGFVQAYQDVATVFADITPTKATEGQINNASISFVAYKMIVRYSSNTEAIDTSMRIVYNGDNYRIQSVLNMDEADRFLEIMTTRDDQV
jgi:SPP1 family predicted phage head-tail adaptor